MNRGLRAYNGQNKLAQWVQIVSECRESGMSVCYVYVLFLKGLMLLVRLQILMCPHYKYRLKRSNAKNQKMT